MSNVDQKKVLDFLENANIEEIAFLLQQISDKIIIPVVTKEGITEESLVKNDSVIVCNEFLQLNTEHYIEKCSEINYQDSEKQHEHFKNNIDKNFGE
mgnify:CR=1 FL=1